MRFADRFGGIGGMMQNPVREVEIEGVVGKLKLLRIPDAHVRRESFNRQALTHDTH